MSGDENMNYRYEIKKNRLYLYCVCDSTEYFAYTLRALLTQLKFTSIQLYGHRLEKGDERIPKDKQWCDYEYVCSGIFPNDEVRSMFDRNGGTGILRCN